MSKTLLETLHAMEAGHWLIPFNAGFSSADVKPLYDRGIIELASQMGMTTCRLKPEFGVAEAEKIANCIVGAFIVEPSEKVRGLIVKWVAGAINDAAAKEREACAKVADRQCQSYDFRDYQEDALRSECLEIASQIRARASTER